MQQLQPNSTLQGGKYRIEKVLGQGGFGITYLAEHCMLGGKVAVKEFFFKEYCDRDEATSHVTIGTSGNRDLVERFKVKFIKEARTIFKLKHPNIVRILDIFEENGTAYYVMDYIEGESLSDLVKRRRFIPEAEAVGYIRKVADALSYIHSKNMNHLDIKPGNIMKRQEDGQIFVIDFGVAKQYDSNTSEGTTTTPVGISKGYSPNEQYMLGGVQSFSPQSDVYALAATLYKLLTGITPPEAMLVQEEGLPIGELKSKNISQNVINALNAAMLSKRKRTQSIDKFISEIVTHSNEQETIIVDEQDDDSTVVIEDESKDVKIDNDSGGSLNYRKAIEQLQQTENYRDAYDLCLRVIHEGKKDEWLEKKMAELVPQMKRARKKDDNKNILWATLIGVGSLIIYLIYLFNS